MWAHSWCTEEDESGAYQEGQGRWQRLGIPQLSGRHGWCKERSWRTALHSVAAVIHTDILHTARRAYSVAASRRLSRRKMRRRPRCATTSTTPRLTVRLPEKQDKDTRDTDYITLRSPALCGCAGRRARSLPNREKTTRASSELWYRATITHKGAWAA